MQNSIASIVVCLCVACPASSGTISALNVNLLGTASGSIAGVGFVNEAVGFNFRAPRSELKDEPQPTNVEITTYRPDSPFEVSFAIAGLAGTAALGRARWINLFEDGISFSLYPDPDAPPFSLSGRLAQISFLDQSAGFSFDRPFVSAPDNLPNSNMAPVETSLGLLSIASWQPVGYFHLFETMDDPGSSEPGQGPGAGNRPTTPPGLGSGPGRPQVVPTPLPAPALLLLSGLGLIAVVRRRARGRALGTVAPA